MTKSTTVRKGWCWAILATLPMALTAVAGEAEAGKIRVSKSIEFSIHARPGRAVAAECDLQTRVPAFLAEASPDIELVEGKPGNSGKSISMEITQVHAPGGGIFSGPKWLEVTGKLRAGGKEIGSFRAKRLAGGLSSTCGMLHRSARAIGVDIAAWLASPTKNAELGDAR